MLKTSKKLLFVFILSFSFFSDLSAQQLSVMQLYLETSMVFQCLQNSRPIEALNKADSLIPLYQNLEGSGKYFTYLYLYKAEAYLSLGDLVLAQHYDSVALLYANQTGNDDLSHAILNNLAVINQEKGDYALCLEQCAELTEQVDEQELTDRQAMIFNNMALCAGKLERYQLADSLYDRLLNMDIEGKRFFDYDRFLTHRNFGMYRLQFGDYKSAHQHLLAALDGYLDSLGQDHFQVAQSYLYLGDYYTKINQNDSGLICLDQAIRILNPNEIERAFSQNELLRIKAFRMRADYYFHISELESANKDIRNALENISRIMTSYSATESGMIIAGMVRPLFNLAVQITVKQYSDTGSDQYFLQALTYSEMGRKLSLFIRHLRNQDVNFSSVNEHLFKDYYRVREKIKNTNEGTSDLSEGIAELTQIRLKLDSLFGIQNQTWLTNYSPRIKKQLKKVQLLSYYDFGTSFGRFSIIKGKFMYDEIIKDSTFLWEVMELKKSLTIPRKNNYGHDDLDNFLRISSSIERKLLTDIFLGGDKLYIQTDGELNGLPFEVLINEKDVEDGKNLSYRRLPFLITKSPVCYLNSIDGLKRNNRPDGDLCLVNTSPDEDLKFIQSEMSGIKESWPGHVVMGYRPQCQVIHFLGHSEVDSAKLYESSLGWQFRWKTILLDNHTHRAVYLNSCETGTGHYMQGEGVLSLGLAFQLAGATEVVMNLWPVADHESAVLAVSFYQAGGFNSSASSLREAKLEYLVNCMPGSDHPHYWAGTIIESNMDRGINRNLIFLCFALVMVLVGLFSSIVITVLKKHR